MPDDVARFYEKYMPTAKFTLKEKGFNNGEYALRFESDNEVCNVRVRPAKGKAALVIDVRTAAERGRRGRGRRLPAVTRATPHRWMDESRRTTSTETERVAEGRWRNCGTGTARPTRYTLLVLALVAIAFGPGGSGPITSGTP